MSAHRSIARLTAAAAALAMVFGVSACSDNTTAMQNAGSITSIITSDTSITGKLSVSSRDLMPSTNRTIEWMNTVNAKLGFDNDGKPHRLTLKDSDVLAKISWWTQPAEDQSTHRLIAQSTDMVVLSPLSHGDYDMRAICDGTGSFTVELTTDQKQTDKVTMACKADTVSSSNVDVSVAHDNEQVSVRFVPSGTTMAAAGFSLVRKN